MLSSWPSNSWPQPPLLVRHTTPLPCPSLSLVPLCPAYDSLRALKDTDLAQLTRGQLLSQVIDKAADHGLLGEQSC